MKVNAHYVIKFVVIGFFAGIIFRSFFDIGWAVVGLLVVFALMFAVLKHWPVALVCMGLSLGVARYEIKDVPVSEVPTQLMGVIYDEPSEKENSIQYRLKFDNGTRVLVTSRPTPRFEYGDRVKIEGKIKPVENFVDEEGEIFDWQAYLGKDEIYYQVLFPKIELIAHGEGNWLQAKLFDLKHAFLNRLGLAIPEPEASLAGGLDVGAKSSLGKELLEKFRVAGLIHIVVLSGYNITILAIGVMWLLRRKFSERTSIIAGIATILLFAIMTGGGATVFRASVMAIIGFLATATGRTSDVSRALVIAALLMVLWNPKVLVFDIGFQLSFLATLGLIYVEPIFRPHFTWLPEKILGFKFREIASITLGAQVAVFPLILYTFGNFSVYAFPVNMLVLPLVPLTMLFVFLAGFLFLISSFFPPLQLLAFPFAWASYLLLAYMIGLVSLVAHLPFASLTFSHIPLPLILFMYACIIFLVFKFHTKQHS